MVQSAEHNGVDGIKGLSRAEKIQLIALMEEKERRKAGRRLFTYYPDEGPLRRELYPKHLEFFEAGAKYRERLMLAGNRVGKCISGETVLDTPFGEAKKVKDIKGPHWVWSWDGSKRVPALAETPFTKPAETIYRVWLQSGHYVDCAAEHRLLTEAGWLFLSDLFGYVPSLPGSSLGFDPLESHQDVLCLMNKLGGCWGGYPAYHHSSDEQLRRVIEGDLKTFPSPIGVPEHNPLSSCWGGQGNKCKHSHQQPCGLLSTRDDQNQSGGRCAESLYRVSCNYDSRCHYLLRESQLPDVVEASPFQSVVGGVVHRCGSLPALISPFGGYDAIICYQDIGTQDIYDFHVPIFKNYCTGGMVHHNTEGVGGYETALHLTGQYPHWWKGRRFTKPVRAWMAGKTNETTRDIVQTKMCGAIKFDGSKKRVDGTGLIPFDTIGAISWKQGVQDLIDTVKVKHVSGGWSKLGVKAYQQGRGAFEGTEQDVIWLDEEPPLDVYAECLVRTMTTKGIVLLTFTPLEGLSDVVLSFLPGGRIKNA